eukprot:6155931-Pyramimonas_sp.AAC.1
MSQRRRRMWMTPRPTRGKAARRFPEPTPPTAPEQTKRHPASLCALRPSQRSVQLVEPTRASLSHEQPQHV